MFEVSAFSEMMCTYVTLPKKRDLREANIKIQDTKTLKM